MDIDHRTDQEGSEAEGSGIKSCVDCGTIKTPLWRSGPAGPKSLCNACGIKSRKKRGSVLGVGKCSTVEKKAKKLRKERITSSSGSSNKHQSNRSRNWSNSKLSSRQSLKKKLVPLGQEVMFQRSIAERLRKRLGEEEQAAMLLMAISSGYVY